MSDRKKSLISSVMGSLLSLWGCGQPPAPAPEGPSKLPSNALDASREFVDGIVRLGYLSFVDPVEHDQVRGQLVQAVARGSLLTELDESSGAYPAVYPDRRLYGVDAEALAEGIASVVEALAPILHKEGVQLGSVADIHQGDRVALMIGDKEYLIYDWPNQEPPDLDTWGLGHKRLIEIVSELLTEADSRERLYWMGDGNDAHVILLTEEMFRFIRSSSLEFDDYWLPRPADQMPLAHES